MRGHFKFHRLDRLPKTFHKTSKTMEPHTLHFLSKDSTRLDSGRVLIVVYPAITRKWMNESAIFSHKTSSKAYIMVKDLEDLEDLEDDEERAGKDKDKLSR
jgi:hypothetical protein